MKYFYYTAMVFIGEKSYHTIGFSKTDKNEFPVWEIMKDLSEKEKLPIQNVNITFWSEISEYEFKKLEEEYLDDRQE